MTARFWNLSNHPLETAWSQDQRAAAGSWGGGLKRELRDIPFPLVDPFASPADISFLAEATLAKLRGEGGHSGDPVLVMGEQTLTFALVLALQEAGFLPLSATTRREAQEALCPDGSVRKNHTFRFVQFRPYPFLAPAFRTARRRNA